MTSAPVSSRDSSEPISVVKTTGLVAAPFTPMHADRSINLDVIHAYSRHLQGEDIVGAFICGTTGESMSLSIEERMQVADRWMEVAPKDLRVIVHVGHNALGDCRRLASHAQSIGADSISCMAPFFFKPHSAQSLVQWCEEVASAAPGLPFYYYHIPSLTGVSIPAYDFLRIAADRIPNLVGVKFTDEDLDDFQRCLSFRNGRYDVLFGRDERLLSSLGVGACGAVGSTYNFAAPIYRKLIAACGVGDHSTAEAQQELAVKMIHTLIAGGPCPIATFKWFMKRTGIDCGPARAPLQNPSAEQIERLEERLQAIGIFNVEAGV
ncbi:MAG: dihydrodipicolinate synthase family protein [Verrucomicrobiales bacterium]